MLYVFVICVCLSLITGLLGFHDLLHEDVIIVRALFAFFTAGWVAALAFALLRALRGAPRRAG